MGVPSRIPTIVAWIVVAIVVAWAPLFHAICIAPAESAVTTHVMADGTVMTTAAPASDAGSGHAMAAEASAAPATPLLDATGVVGMIVVFAGLAVLTMAVFARYCQVMPSRGDPPRRRTPRLTWFDAVSWRWADVDLHGLGISRT